MRKITALLLISLHLLGNTEAGQVFKLPHLLEHYAQHKKNNPALGFIDFFVMHYGGDDGTTVDDDQDQQLPCHNMHHISATVIYSPLVKTEPDKTIYFWKTRSYQAHISDPVPEMPISVKLQPPRSA